MLKAYKVYDEYTSNLVIATSKKDVLRLMSDHLRCPLEQYMDENDPVIQELPDDRIEVDMYGNKIVCSELIKQVGKPTWVYCKDIK